MTRFGLAPPLLVSRLRVGSVFGGVDGAFETCLAAALRYGSLILDRILARFQIFVALASFLPPIPSDSLAEVA